MNMNLALSSRTVPRNVSNFLKVCIIEFYRADESSFIFLDRQSLFTSIADSATTNTMTVPFACCGPRGSASQDRLSRMNGRLASAHTEGPTWCVPCLRSVFCGDSKRGQFVWHTRLVYPCAIGYSRDMSFCMGFQLESNRACASFLCVHG